MPDPARAARTPADPRPAGEGQPAAPLTGRHDPAAWLPLLDQPLLPPGTLFADLLRLEYEARAHALNGALGGSDPHGLSARLLRVDPGPAGDLHGTAGPHLHRAHLHALTAPHPAALARALRDALGAPPELPDSLEAPETSVQELPDRGPRSTLRLPRLLWQATHPVHTAPVPPDPASPDPASPDPVPTPPDPARTLTGTLSALARHAAHPAPLTAPLCTHLLSRVTRHWLNDTGTLHLELLAEKEHAGAPQHALNQLRTTLTGPRRAAALLTLRVARAQHHALRTQQAGLHAARRAALRAAVQAAATLRARGILNRTADARWLTPAELIAALDGTLDPATLRALGQARRHAAHTQPRLPATVPYGAAPDTLTGAALSPGVRDGRLHRWTPGEHVPPGTVALLPGPPAPHHLPALADAAALIVPRSGLHSPVAAHTRRAGQPAVTLPLTAHDTDWLLDGALVRLNGHSGTLTLLRRAGVPDPIPAFDLNLEVPSSTPATGMEDRPTVLSPHVRVLPRPTPFSIDLA
ncbi:hypothetical protein [Deinococcus knuensis]|uniref:PEP-utilising enzyme mobile domain-containing protein n=1 Tax=Deinococcus knuensis TaxID=1837380 RepID=A0ABQ2SWI3_9DEIO|nr:hypothetical protein [Deinococcus knuensis]GGS40342.1 hypothetical protein GCM10008961_34690 [Deinococcus knuensis]